MIRRDRAAFEDKPLWVILTEHAGQQDGWCTDVEGAANSLRRMLRQVTQAGACPMVWSTIPSQDPWAPGFTDVSVYNEPTLADVLRCHLADRS